LEAFKEYGFLEQETLTESHCSETGDLKIPEMKTDKNLS